MIGPSVLDVFQQRIQTFVELSIEPRNSSISRVPERIRELIPNVNLPIPDGSDYAGEAFERLRYRIRVSQLGYPQVIAGKRAERIVLLIISFDKGPIYQK